MINTRKIFSALPVLAKKNPIKKTSVITPFSVPLAVIYQTSEFIKAPLESLVLFGFLSISVLLYSAWVVSTFKKSAKEESDENP